MRIIFYILLILGIIGVVRAVINFFMLVDGFPKHAGHEDWFIIYNTPMYREYVSRAADSLILIAGSLLFFWLL